MNNEEEELGKLSEIRQTIGAEIMQSIDSLLYITLFTRSSQTEAAAFIYGKSAIKVNQSPIINAKRRMLKLGYLEGTDATKTSHQQYLSTPKPIIDYIKMSLSEKYKHRSKSKTKAKYHLSDKEEEMLFNIINSNWFRSFLSKDKINAGNCSFIYRNKDGSLSISNSAMEIITSLLEDISTLNIAFYGAKLANKRPNNKEFDVNINFDEFAEKWIDKNFRNEVNFIESVIKKGAEYYKEETAKVFLNYSSNLFFLCMPPDLAFKLVHTGRIQTTILTGINNGMVNLLEEDLRKWQGYFKEEALRNWDVPDAPLSMALTSLQ